MTTLILGRSKGQSACCFLPAGKLWPGENKQLCAHAALLAELGSARGCAVVSLQDEPCKQAPAEQRGQHGCFVTATQHPDKVGLMRSKHCTWFFFAPSSEASIVTWMLTGSESGWESVQASRESENTTPVLEDRWDSHGSKPEDCSSTVVLSTTHRMAPCFECKLSFLTSAPGISIQLHLSGLLATYRFAFNVAFFFFKWVTQSNLLSLTEKDALSFYIYSIICCLASIQTEQQRKTQHVSSIHNASSAVITQTSDFFLASRATINVQKSTYLTKKIV